MALSSFAMLAANVPAYAMNTVPLALPAAAGVCDGDVGVAAHGAGAVAGTRHRRRAVVSRPHRACVGPGRTNCAGAKPSVWATDIKIIQVEGCCSQAYVSGNGVAAPLLAQLHLPQTYACSLLQCSLDLCLPQGPVPLGSAGAVLPVAIAGMLRPTSTGRLQHS